MNQHARFTLCSGLLLVGLAVAGSAAAQDRAPAAGADAAPAAGTDAAPAPAAGAPAAQ